MRRLLAVTAAALAFLGWTATPAHAATPGFHGLLNDNFSWNVPTGAWSDCNHNADTPKATCKGLPSWASAHWWAYPAGWPDTATQRHYPMGGYYDPASTVSVSGGALHIRMWRGKTGSVHSATVVPRQAMGLKYGAYEERWRVSRVARGYKSAHLLWPNDNSQCCEEDFPEGDWDSSISGYNHDPAGNNLTAADAGARWTSWHTTRIEWRPGSVRYFLDGRLLDSTTRDVPRDSMNWDVQNESSLDGESAAPNSWAQMDIDYVRVWSWS
jgi:beta-glucanase (GH16 family)